MRRVNLEKMEKKGRREGVSSVHVLVGHSWLELLPDDVYFIFGFLNYGIGSSRDLMLYMVNFVNILSFVLLTQDAISSCKILSRETVVVDILFFSFTSVLGPYRFLKLG